MHRRAWAAELRQRRAGKHFRKHLRERACDRHRRHGAGEDERRDDRPLLRPRIDLQRAEHGASKTIGELALISEIITQLFVDELLAEHHLGHRHGIRRALGMRDRAHEGFVGIADVRIDHVEVALVDRHVDRLAHSAAGMVDRRRHVGELHEIAEILDRAVAAALVEVAHEGRTVDRREHGGVAADLDRALGVARVLREGLAAPS